MYITLLIILILLSSFFSAAETGMMAVNRYRLRHLSRKSHKSATRVLKLLERPDRLLGVILIADTFADILASATVTVAAMHWYGDMGVLIASIGLTFVVLIVGEIAPKTLAAMHPQRTAMWVSGPLTFLLKMLYPLVWVVNGIANGLLKLLGVSVSKAESEVLTMDELRSVVHEAAGKTSLHYQNMLLRIIDLQQMTVEEVMVPKNEIYGIDLDQDWDTIVSQLMNCSHAHLPLYREHINNIQGMLTLRHTLVKLRDPHFDLAALIALAEEPYFIPEGAPLHQQVLNFQQTKQHIGLVVDEYSVIQGLLSLRDVLEEVIGDFTQGRLEAEEMITKHSDHSVVVDGSINIRDLNRLMNWHFPVEGPRTMSGLIIEYLEMIPKTLVCVRIAGYPLEVLSVSENRIEEVHIWPKPRH